MKKTLILLFTLAMAIITQSKEYTLETAVETALINNNEINGINKEIEIKELHYEEALKQNLPKFSYSGNLTKLSDETTLLYGVQLLPYTLDDSDTVFSNKLVISQPVYTGGAIKNSIKIQGLSKSITEIELDQKKREIKLQVSTNYLEVLKLQKTREILENSLKEMNKIHNNLEESIQVGLVQKKPLLDIKYRISDIKSSIISIDNAIRLRKMNLKMLMKTDEEISVKNIDIPKVEISDIAVETDIKYALNNKDAIKALDLSREISLTNENIQKSDLLPKVYFNFGYELFGQKYGYETNDSWTASLNISMDIFDFGKRKSAIEAVKKEVEAKEIDKSIAEDKLKLAINSAYFEIEKNKDIIDVKKEALESAKENYRIEKDKFGVLLNTSTDLLSAENSVTKTEAELINSQIAMYISYLQYNYLIEREGL